MCTICVGASWTDGQDTRPHPAEEWAQEEI